MCVCVCVGGGSVRFVRQDISAEILTGTREVASELKIALQNFASPILRGLESHCELEENTLRISTSDSKVNFIRYQPGALWSEFHWDHLNHQYGNILLCLQAPDEGGCMFMDVGRSRFQLESGQVAAWVNYDKEGNLVREVSLPDKKSLCFWCCSYSYCISLLLRQACHAAGSVWGNRARLVMSVCIQKAGFQAPQRDILEAQARHLFPAVKHF